MPKPFELTLKIEGHADLIVCGEFTDSEQVILQRHLEQYDQLIESKPLREGIPCHISFKCEQGKAPRMETSLPDNDTLSILLHRLRPFILQNEPSSYIAVSTIIGRRVHAPHLRRFLREQRKLYDGREAQQQMRISSNKVIVNSENVLNDWLNSHEYHRDPDKREAVDALFAHMPDDFMRALMVSMLVDKVKAIINMAELVAVLLGQAESLQFNIRPQTCPPLGK